MYSLVVSALLCLHFMEVSGTGKATMIEIIKDQAEAAAAVTEIQPGDCAILYLQGEKVKGGSSFKKLMDPPVWPGSILIGQDWPFENSDGSRGCFRDPLASDETGAQCLNCLMVNDVITESHYCSQSETRQYWEYFNDTPNKIDFKFWGSKFESAANQNTAGFECIPLNGPVANTCQQSDLPSCNWKGDASTGGLIRGSPLHPSVACECVCLGDWTSESNGCSTPPSCDFLDLTGSPNVNPDFQKKLFSNDSFGAVVTDSNLNQSMFDGSSDSTTMMTLTGDVCVTGYKLDTSVTLSCPKKDDTATASGDVCIVSNDDCQSMPCGMGQTCVDNDNMPNSMYECSCEPPGMGTNQNGPVASCGPETDCTDAANVCVAAGQDCVDTDMMKNSNFECTCKPPNSATVGMNAAAMCPTANDCDGTDACTAAGQDCVDMDGMKDMNYLCKCKPPDTGESMNAAATCTQSTSDCSSNPCGTGQDCVDTDMSINMMFTCNCKPPTVGTSMGSPATCQDDCTNSVTCGADQTCNDSDGLLNSNFRCDCNAPLQGTNTNATAVCAAASQDDCSKVPAVCGANQTCSDPDMTADNMYTCSCDSPSTGTAMGAPAVCTQPTNDCIPNPCSAGQTCSDSDNTINRMFACVCDAPATGTAANGPATCSSTPAPDDGDDKFLMGLIIGLSVAIICLIGCLYMFWRWKVAKKEAKNARSMQASLPEEESRATPLLPIPVEEVKEEPVVKPPTPPPPPPPKPKEVIETESDCSSESAFLTPPTDPLISGKELVADANEDLSSLETPPSPPARVNLRFNSGTSGRPVITSVCVVVFELIL